MANQVEYRLQCTKTGRIWARPYDNPKAAAGAQWQWNSTASVPPNSTNPPVRVVEVELVIRSVVREPKNRTYWE